MTTAPNRRRQRGEGSELTVLKARAVGLRVARDHGLGAVSSAAILASLFGATPALAQDAAAPSAPPAAAANQEVVVTGSRIARSGFQAPTPVTVLSAARIEKLGIPNVGDLLNQIPAFRATTTPVVSGLTYGTIGARVADLRGLGATRTLVLLDGRRFVPSTSQGTVDLNNIPAILLQRSEVVTGGASAAYGSDAVAGVVNLILDTKLNGLRAQAQYGSSELGDGQDYQFALAAGGGFAGGKGHIVASVEYENSRAIGDCYTRAWCATERQALTNSTPGVNGFPANVIITNVHTSTMTRGGLITAGPLKGIQFAPDGTPVPFTYGALAGGLFQIGGSGKGQNAFITGVDIKVPVTRYNGYVHSQYDFTDSLQGFLDASYSYVDGRNLGGATRDTGSITIQLDNAFLPASIHQLMVANHVTNFKMGREGVDFGFMMGEDVTKTYRVVAGLKGDLGHGWSWNAYYQFGKSDFVQTVADNRNNANFSKAVDAVIGPNGLPVCRSTLTSPGNGCVALNLFGQNNWSIDAKNYVYGTSFQTRSIVEHVAAASVQGEPLSTWAGPISVGAGAEYRRDEATGDADAVSKVLGWQSGNGSAINGSVGVGEGYIETIVPLAKDAPFAHSLEFNGAVRLTDYSTSGAVVTWKAGLVYEPTDWLRFRGTRSRDIRAPNVSELFSPQTLAQATINDKATLSQGVFFTIASGNATLQPEKGDTWTGGVVFMPKWGWSRNLRLSADYYDITLNNAIATVVPQNVVNQCFQGVTYFCQFIIRDSTNTIQQILLPYLNLNTVKTNGIDLEAQYHLPLADVVQSWQGSLDFSMYATYVAHLTTIQSTGSLDIAGVTGCAVTSTFECVPHWTLDGTISYTRGPLSLTAHGHYIPKSVYDPTFVGPEDPGYSPFLANSINTNRVSARLYVDLHAQYDVVHDGAKVVQVFGAVENVSDTPPPMMPGRGNNTFYDPIGRYYRVGVRLKM